jgi:hypothetical protein
LEVHIPVPKPLSPAVSASASRKLEAEVLTSESTTAAAESKVTE